MIISKDLQKTAESDFVVRLDRLGDALQNVSLSLEPLRTRVERHLQKEDLQNIDNIRRSIGRCMTDVMNAKQNLDSVTEILNTRKASLELKEIAFRSWPKRSYIERMTWIATALFPAGGFPFVLAGGVNSASLTTALVTWSVGSAALVLSLWMLKRDDDDKWEFYENEFGIQRSLSRALRETFRGVKIDSGGTEVLKLAEDDFGKNA